MVGIMNFMKAQVIFRYISVNMSPTKVFHYLFICSLFYDAFPVTKTI
jgi:hypothetical protein